MVSAPAWKIAGAVRYLADAVRRDASVLPSSSPASTPPRKSLKFPRAAKIKLKGELDTVRRTGTKIRTRSLEVRVLESSSQHPRVGIVVYKYNRTVVERNRLRRRLRELVRTRLLPHMMDSIDVFI